MIRDLTTYDDGLNVYVRADDLEAWFRSLADASRSTISGPFTGPILDRLADTFAQIADRETGAAES